MDAEATELTIKAYLKEVRERLDKAAGIAHAADACDGYRTADLRSDHAHECREPDPPDFPDGLIASELRFLPRRRVARVLRDWGRAGNNAEVSPKGESREPIKYRRL